LTLSPAQRTQVGVLADLIIPADETSGSATSVGAIDCIDEWVSAPYSDCRRDRPIVLAGLTWLDEECGRRYQRSFIDASSEQQHALCDSICDASRVSDALQTQAHFFALFRDLTAAAFYTTAVGRRDLGYIGNVAQTQFDGPPADLLARLQLS
jgi:hypothetical protein